MFSLEDGLINLHLKVKIILSFVDILFNHFNNFKPYVHCF